MSPIKILTMYMKGVLGSYFLRPSRSGQFSLVLMFVVRCLVINEPL